MIELTDRQARVLAFVREHIDRTGYPPTRVDIARELGFRSPNAAEEHLRALERKGAIEMTPGRSRGLRLPETERTRAAHAQRLAERLAEGLPIVGRVAAGQPILAAENIEEHCAIAANFFRPAADYLLRVRGESMRDAGILDGDLLAVQRTPVAQNGQIIVARIDDEVTVKRLQRGKTRQRLTLHAENPDFAPIEVDLAVQSFAIEGLAVGVLRRH